MYAKWPNLGVYPRGASLTVSARREPRRSPQRTASIDSASHRHTAFDPSCPGYVTWRITPWGIPPMASAAPPQKRSGSDTLWMPRNMASALLKVNVESLLKAQIDSSIPVDTMGSSLAGSHLSLPAAAKDGWACPTTAASSSSAWRWYHGDTSSAASACIC
jgi:hypothetical protein